LRGILWSYGASVTSSDGHSITINSPQTAEALQFVDELYHQALDPQVLSWDDAHNNRSLISGKSSFTLNPISAYKTALKHGTKIPGTDRPVYEELNHYLPPEGPAGRHMYSYSLLLGIWKFSKNKARAREFLDYHFSKKRFNAYILASDGYNQPLLRDLADHPIWSSNPKYSFASQIGQYSHTQGYPAPPSKYSQIIMDLYIIPDMFSYVVTGRMKIKEAMERAEKEIRQVYKGMKGPA
jgi:multiple sugar transport system substrate-binding protein